jgi:hypothetical protein
LSAAGLPGHGRAEAHQRGHATHLIRVTQCSGRQRRAHRVDHVIDLGAEHAPDRLVQHPATLQLRVRGKGLTAETVKQRHFFQLLERDQPGANAVVNVVCVVGYFVSQVAQLGFQAGLGPVDKPPSHTARVSGLELFGIRCASSA